MDTAVHPFTCLPLAPPSAPLCRRAPWDARGGVLEVSLIADRPFFGKTPEGLHLAQGTRPCALSQMPRLLGGERHT